MRKIYFEDLPHHSNGTISWKECVGKSVRFEYDAIHGVIDILAYDTSKYHLTLQYEDRIRDMFVGSFKDGGIKELIGLRHSEYRYNVGDILFDTFLVKEQTKIKHAKMRSKSAVSRSGMNKAYLLQCLKCKYEFTIGEDVLDDRTEKDNCPGCGIHLKNVICGVNDMWTTAPELASLLDNPEDGYILQKTSNKKTNWRCSYCNSLIKDKQPSYIYVHGLHCNKCKDKISYPEKIMRAILLDQNIKFEMHVRFSWSQGKEYDFYLPNYNWIIETHGSQHYEEAFRHIRGKRNLEEEQYNDKFKDLMANYYGIDKYTVIDCRESDFDFIYNNIINSNIAELISHDINLDKIKQESAENFVKIACDMWNDGDNDIEHISSIIGLGTFTITEYLKKGRKLGLCNYNGLKTKKALNRVGAIKPVRCIPTGREFQSMSDGARFYNTHACSIRRSCDNHNLYSGKLPDGTKLYWEYIGQATQTN